MNSIYSKFPNNQEINTNNNLHDRKFKKEKQIKIKWTKEEQNLFLEGIEKFGMKSKIFYNFFFKIKIDLKQVSEHIKTRNVGQVRSHLQKYLIKEKKKKEIENKIKKENEKKEEKK